MIAILDDEMLMARVLDGDPLDEQPGAGGEHHEVVGAHSRCGAAIDGP